MPWYAIAQFFAGVFLCNAIPHFVMGVCGEKFQSPFAKPPGAGLSSPLVNVIWGFANGVAGGALLLFWPPESLIAYGVVALGVLLMGLMAASHFGKVRGNS